MGRGLFHLVSEIRADADSVGEVRGCGASRRIQQPRISFSGLRSACKRCSSAVAVSRAEDNDTAFSFSSAIKGLVGWSGALLSSSQVPRARRFLLDLLGLALDLLPSARGGGVSRGRNDAASFPCCSASLATSRATACVRSSIQNVPSVHLTYGAFRWTESVKKLGVSRTGLS